VLVGEKIIFGNGEGMSLVFLEGKRESLEHQKRRQRCGLGAGNIIFLKGAFGTKEK
jgi:hypothetical protein